MKARLPHIATDTATPLPLLADLRQAVAAELEAARAQAALVRVEVLSGRRGAAAGGGHLYTFLLSALLPVPDDTPGELHIGRRVHPCRIVGVEGLRVTVLLAEAPARFIERATLAAQPWTALARLDAALAKRAAGAGLSAALFSGEIAGLGAAGYEYALEAAMAALEE